MLQDNLINVLMH